jgi:hypothetical protein
VLYRVSQRKASSRASCSFDQLLRPLSLAEIKNWPATVSVTRCAVALGVGKTALYDQIKRGELPVRTIRVGAP